MEYIPFPSLIISASSRRSGSTWLQRVIHASTDIFVWGESFPLVELLTTTYANFQKNQTVQEEETSQFLSSSQDPTVWVANITPPFSNLKAANRSFFSEFYKGTDRPRYGWKEVHYGRSELDFIRELFPETKILLLVRNPFPVAASLSKLGWMGRFEDTPDLQMVAELWRERTSDYLALRNDPGFFFIRYEDVHSRLDKILAFVGGTRTDALQRALGTYVSKTENTSSALSEEDKALITSICGQEMLELGYLEHMPEARSSQGTAVPIQNSIPVRGPTDLSSAENYGAVLAYKRELLKQKSEFAEQEKKHQFQLDRRDQTIDHLKLQIVNLNAMIAERNQRITDLDGRMIDFGQAISEDEACIASLSRLIDEMRSSRSWNVTKPFRYAARFVHRPKEETYNLLRFVFRKLPGSLKIALRVPAKWVAERAKRDLLPAEQKKPEDLTWEEFQSEVLSGREQYKGIFIQEVIIDWGVPLYQRPQHLAAVIGRSGYLVIYRTLNNLVDNVNGVRNIAENVWLTNCPQADQIPGAVRSIYSTSFYLDIRTLIQKVHPQRFLVYEYIDHIDPMISGSDENVKRLHDLKEFAFHGGADLIVASSRRLEAEAISAVGKEKVLYLPNGVDVEHYRNPIHGTTPLPESLMTFRKGYRNLVGYFGAIAPWLWYEAINELAHARPDIGFVFIGPDYHYSIEKLPQTQNVLYLGTVEYGVLPAYARQFDACFIPFARSEIAHTTSPLKLFEYFALEKPVVTTSFIDECIAFPEVFHGDSVQTLSAAIDRALAVREDPAYRSRLAKLASANTWKERANNYESAFYKSQGFPIRAIQKIISTSFSEDGNPNNYFDETYKFQEKYYWMPVLGWISQLKNIGSILNIGSAYGTLLLYAGLNHDANSMTVIDPVEYMSPNLKNKYSITTYQRNIETENVSELGKFDLVIFTEVIEHLNFHPLPTLLKIKELMHEDSYLLLSTPDADDWGRVTDYYPTVDEMPYFSGQDQPRIDAHIYQYTRDELEMLLKRAGFQVEKFSHSPGIYRQHLCYLLRLEH